MASINAMTPRVPVSVHSTDGSNKNGRMIGARIHDGEVQTMQPTVRAVARGYGAVKGAKPKSRIS